MAARLSTPSADGAFERISGDVRKADIIDVALQVFSERGYDGSSLQEIAERVGILKGSVYYYYQSKNDLLFDVMKFVHDDHLDNVRHLASITGTPIKRLHAILMGHAIFVCQNLARTTVFLREMNTLTPEQRAEIVGPDHSYQQLFRDVITGAQKDGEIPVAINPKLATLWILGSLNWLHRWFRPDGAETPEAVARHFADQLVRGLKSSSLIDGISPN